MNKKKVIETYHMYLESKTYRTLDEYCKAKGLDKNKIASKFFKFCPYPNRKHKYDHYMEHYKACKSQGMTLKAYAEQHGLPCPTFREFSAHVKQKKL